MSPWDPGSLAVFGRSGLQRRLYHFPIVSITIKMKSTVK